MDRTTPVTARVVKTIAFTVPEWEAIEELMHHLGAKEFTTLCRVALASLADDKDIDWPDPSKRKPAQADPPSIERAS